MTKNPILDDLHAVREQMLADAGGTLAGLVAKIQTDQAASGRTILKTSGNHTLHRNGDEHPNNVEQISTTR